MNNKWTKIKPLSIDEFFKNRDKIKETLEGLCPEWVPSNPDSLPQADTNPFFDELFNFTEFNVALSSRGDKSAPGLDGINYEVLHNLPIKYHLLLLDIFNEMFTNNVYPDSWRETYVHFVEKPNRKGYRPLALMSCTCKLFELMISNRVRWWVEHYELLPVAQTGFRKGLSCADNLTCFKLDIEEALNNNEQVMAVFLDVSNAFNDVRSDILLDKLADIGCSPKILKFIKFLTYERKIYSEINETKPMHAYKGVAQGGVFSPLSYLIYTIDMGKKVRHPHLIKILQFADDTVIYIRTNDPDNSKMILEEAIEVICKNLRDLGLDVSSEKTDYVHFNRDEIEPGDSNILVRDMPVVSKEFVKFLGIYFDYKLSFTKHIAYVQEKTNRSLNIVKFLRGTWWGSHPETLLTFYKSYVRSLIDYGSFIYFPTQKAKKLKIERIQFSAIRMIFGFRMSTPTNILMAESKLTTIEHRSETLCCNFLLKTLSIKRSISYITIKKYIPSIIKDRRKKISILKKCIKKVTAMEYLIHSDNYPNIYNYDYCILKSIINVNYEIGRKLQKSANPSEQFELIFKNDNAIKIFTDGSKGGESKSVGSACVCMDLDIINHISSDSNASIYTAECLALSSALDVALQHPHLNFNIFTDSLSIVQSLKTPPNSIYSNYNILEIRQKYLNFQKKNENSKIIIYWIPAHKGITGNELADTEAKFAAEQYPTRLKLPFSDLKLLYKSISMKDTLKLITDAGETKGQHYFQNYFTPCFKPWFKNKNLSRVEIVSICRFRSNHYNLKASLKKINVVEDTVCECGNEEQTLNHIIWQCPNYEKERTMLTRSLRKKRQYPPYDVQNYLSTPNISVMKLIIKFLKDCDLKI